MYLFVKKAWGFNDMMVIGKQSWNAWRVGSRKAGKVRACGKMEVGKLGGWEALPCRFTDFAEFIGFIGLKVWRLRRRLIDHS
jgi:hypothetical protein